MINFKNILKEKSTITLIVIFLFFSYVLIDSNYVMSKDIYLFILTTIIQITVSLMGILLIIAIFKMQIINTSIKSTFKDFCERNDKIKKVKDEVFDSMTIGFMTIFSTFVFTLLNTENIMCEYDFILFSSLSIAMFSSFIVSFTFNFEKI